MRLRIDRNNSISINGLKKEYRFSLGQGKMKIVYLNASRFMLIDRCSHLELLHEEDKCWVPVTIVNYVFTTPHIGGRRFWFECPECQRRVGCLVNVEKRFACRHCLNGAYLSEIQEDPDRLYDKMQNLRKYLGIPAGKRIGEKPKNMQWKRYSRLMLEFFELEKQWLITVSQNLRRR